MKVRLFAESIPRGRRALLGAGLFLGGSAALFGAIFIIAGHGGFGTFGAFLAVSTVGLAFIHAITLATALLVSLAMPELITKDVSQASVTNEEPENS